MLQQKTALLHSSSAEGSLQLCGVSLLQSRQAVQGSAKSPLQQVSRSTVFPQVLISPLGRSSKLGTEANDRGGDLHSVVGSKSTPAGGKRRMKLKKVMELLLLLAVTHPNLSTFLLSFSTFSFHTFPLLAFSFSHSTYAVSASFLALLIAFHCFCRFHLTASPHPSLHQPNFLSLSLTVAFSLLPHPLFSPPTGTISRDQKKEVSFVTT